jgi:hypothetical protein
MAKPQINDKVKEINIYSYPAGHLIELFSDTTNLRVTPACITWTLFIAERYLTLILYILI